MPKYLLNSKKSSTFAPAFQEKQIGRSPWGPRKSADFWGERRPRETYLIRRGRMAVRGSRTRGAIAQLVEQRTENPCVPSSILGGTTKKRLNGLFFGAQVPESN